MRTLRNAVTRLRWKRQLRYLDGYVTYLRVTGYHL